MTWATVAIVGMFVSFCAFLCWMVHQEDLKRIEQRGRR